MDRPLVSVIILNYNGLRFLDGCLTSVLRQDYQPFEVILVDNNSEDGSADAVGGRYPSVRVIRSDRNLGFAGGNNLGVGEARGNLIVLLNNDTTVEAGWLAALVDGMDDGRVAIAASFVRTEGVAERYYERNGSVNFLGHNIMRIFRDKEEIFYAGGTSMIFRKDLIGIPFDDLYFAYSEDLYCSLRARFMGYGVMLVPASVVHHAGGGTSRKTPSERLTMLQERNRLLTVVLFFSRWTLLRILPLLAANCAAKIVVAAFSSRYSLAGIINAYLWFPLYAGWIRRKREELRREQRRPEGEIIALMTSRVTNGESSAGRMLNTFSSLYCRLAGLRTIERTMKEER